MNDNTHFSILEQLDQLEEIVLEGTRLPFSGGRLINEQDAVEVLDAMREVLPSQVKHADQLLQQCDELIRASRSQAENIVSQAQQQHKQLVSTTSVRQEAERQVAELREQTRQQCKQLLQSTRQQSAQMEQEMQSRLTLMEQQFAARQQQLEQEGIKRCQQLDAKAVEHQQQLVKQYEHNRLLAMQELEQVRQEGIRLQREARLEADRLHQDALQFHQQTQQQCEVLIQRSRKEAILVQDSAKRCAEQVFGELEQRLKEISQTIMVGRHELFKIRALQEDSEVSSHRANPHDEDKILLSGYARRNAERIGSVKDTS